jgi:spoIIIJ-associated protein
MDWVETTGKSVEEATNRALAHLGVHQNDAEIEIVEEPKAGLFGRVKGEARVRARVRPAGPRPKRGQRPSRNERSRDGRPSSKSSKPKSNDAPEGAKKEKPQGGQNRRQEKPKAAPRPEKQEKENGMAEGISLAEQGTIAKDFLVGLLEAMSIKAEVTVKELDAETVEILVDADPPAELGVLVGHRGVTLQALQEVTRTVVQAKSPARTDRILVDVARYRERRVAALGRFAEQIAAEVVETGEERALEPMSSADRKAVHDALTGNTAVVTRSEGEEPRRFVVIAPA